jgi:hypothetical protein
VALTTTLSEPHRSNGGRNGSGVRVRARESLLMADTEPIGVGAEVNDQQVHASVLQSRRYGAPDPACRAG